MLSRPVTLALVAAGCMAAAGLGAYVAVRESAGGLSAQPAAAQPARPAAAAPASRAVAETEAAVAPEPAPEVKADVPATPAPAAAPESGRTRAASPERSAVREPENPRPAREPEPAPEPPTVAVEPGAPVGAGEPVEIEPYEPPQPVYEELIVSADSVLGLELETPVSSDTARIEDPVEARITRDVMVGGKVAVPAGTRALGTVTLVEPGGKVRARARLGVRFHTLVLADRTRVPIETDPIYRDGEAPSNQSVAKIGGAAVGGAILGAIFGGTRGAVIGGATGAAGGTAVVMAGERKPATMPPGSTVTVRLVSPVTITVER